MADSNDNLNAPNAGACEEVPLLSACSHVLFTTTDVSRMLRFVEVIFQIQPRFENEEFGEFVLPSGFRMAWFRVTGKVARHFREQSDRSGSSIGVTVTDVDLVHRRVGDQGGELGLETGGEPRDHSWGERSFLLIDPDGNRWEVTQNVSESGMLPQRDGSP